MDLTETHGINITLQRLIEMAGVYDPAVEMASLNLDHNWGGPSLGWCERVWLQDAALWVRYIDLDPGDRRADPEQALHPQIGRDRAQPSRHRRLVSHRLCPPGQRPPRDPRAPARDPLPSPVRPHRPKGDPHARRRSPGDPRRRTTQPVRPSGEVELAALRAQVAEGAQALSTLLRQRAELDVDRRLAQLGARVTPAMAKLARPLLVELLADRTPATVKLQADPAKPATEVSIADQVLQILAAVPAVEALTAGRMADADPAARQPGALAPEREAELEQKYRFSASWGFRSN